MAEALPRLWVYKCNTAQHDHQWSWGDWDDVLMADGPVPWGTTELIGSALSRRLIEHEMAVGDLVLAWQTNRAAAVGLCRITKLERYVDLEGDEQTQIYLQRVGEPFVPVKLHQLKRTNTALAKVRALQPAFVGTIYETTPREAVALLRACDALDLAGASRGRKSGRSPDLAGGGFGSVAENAKVEAAAVAVFEKRYRSWRRDDRQRERGLGYDFEATKGSQVRHLEVKGVRGEHPSFILTYNEWHAARSNPWWHLFVVTDALGKPKVHEWTGEKLLEEFDLKPISYVARRR